MTAALTCALVVLFYAAAYQTLVRRCGPLVEPVIGRLGLGATAPARDVRAVGKLVAAALAQALFALALLLLSGARPALVPESDPIALLLLGATLGIGEIALASTLCTAIVQAGSRADPGAAAAWLSRGRGGWMTLFGGTLRAAPAWLAGSTIALYVGVEELIFRGILIELLRPQGAVVAIGLSLLLFASVQAFHMPSLRAALFPVAGAVVIGLVHGLLFWSVPALLPLVVAHLTFFLGATWLVAPRVVRA